MQLKDLLYKVSILRLIGEINVDISNIQYDSRKISSNGLFVAIKGKNLDGNNYIKSAIKNGAVAIIVEQIPVQLNNEVTYIKVSSATSSLAFIASNFYNNPSERIKLVGVTGTNGKTTIVWLLYQLFKIFELKIGMLSTIENRIIDKVIPSTHTTGDPLQINYLLSEMIEKGCHYCFMEVSSHAIDQERILGLQFAGGIFTNITHEHLDYHYTFSDYRDVKKSFFDSLNKNAFALTNKDDKNGLKMLEGTRAKKLSYSLKTLADYRCKVLENQFEGMLLKINSVDVWVKLIGDFNAYNLIAVFAVAKQFGYEDLYILSSLSMLNSAEGRFQYIRNKEAITGIVDYAHTPDSLRNMLININTIKKRSDSLITIFGCGGDRDKSKRPIMTRVACELSTHVIITSDNPRSENPELIVKDMMNELNPVYIKKILVIANRRQAIMTAGKLARKNDIILLAGKGHEKYQEIKGKKFPFNDMEELKKSLNIILQ